MSHRETQDAQSFETVRKQSAIASADNSALTKPAETAPSALMESLTEAVEGVCSGNKSQKAQKKVDPVKKKNAEFPVSEDANVPTSPRGSTSRSLKAENNSINERPKRVQMEKQCGLSLHDEIMDSLVAELGAVDRSDPELAIEKFNSVLSQGILTIASLSECESLTNKKPSQEQITEQTLSRDELPMEASNGSGEVAEEGEDTIGDSSSNSVTRPGAYREYPEDQSRRSWGLGSFFRRSYQSARTQPTAPVELQAVLVDDYENEETMRQRVRQQVESELVGDSVDAVPIDPEEAKTKSRRLALCTFLVLLLMATVIGVSVGLTRNKDSNDASQFGVLATVPETICYDRFPGQGHALGILCNRSQTLPQGGGVCNIVSKAFLEMTPSADICITNSGACRSDIAAGEFRSIDAEVLLPFEDTLQVLQMTGQQIVQSLNDGLVYALNPLFGTTGAYPYGNAIRYDVNANMSLIRNVEVNPRLEGEWLPIQMDRVYSVVVLTFLADGGDDYLTFAEIPDEFRNSTGKASVEALREYAMHVGVIEDLPMSEYSTQGYIPPPGIQPP